MRVVKIAAYKSTCSCQNNVTKLHHTEQRGCLPKKGSPQLMSLSMLVKKKRIINKPRTTKNDDTDGTQIHDNINIKIF